MQQREERDARRLLGLVQHTIELLWLRTSG